MVMEAAVRPNVHFFFEVGMRVRWFDYPGTVKEVLERSAIVQLDEPYERQEDTFEISFDALVLLSKPGAGKPQTKPSMVNAGDSPRRARLRKEQPQRHRAPRQPDEVAPEVPLAADNQEPTPPSTISNLPKTLRPGYKRKAGHGRGGGRKASGEVRKCLGCGKERYFKPSAIKQGAGRYCYDCRGIPAREAYRRRMESQGEAKVEQRELPVAKTTKAKERAEHMRYYDDRKDEIIAVCKQTSNLEQATKQIKVPFTKSGTIYRTTLVGLLKRWGISAEDLDKAQRAPGKPVPIGSKKPRGVTGMERRRRTKWYEEHREEIIEACATHETLAEAGQAIAVPWDPGYLTKESLRLKMLRWGMNISDINRMRAERKVKQGFTVEAIFTEMDAGFADCDTYAGIFGYYKLLKRMVASERKGAVQGG